MLMTYIPQRQGVLYQSSLLLRPQATYAWLSVIRSLYSRLMHDKYKMPLLVIDEVDTSPFVSCKRYNVILKSYRYFLMQIAVFEIPIENLLNLL